MLSNASVVWSGLGASGTSDSFQLTRGATSAQIASTVISIAAGTTLTVFLDVLVGGQWQQAVALTAQTTAGVQTGLLANVHATGADDAATARLRWTVAGGMVSNAILVVNSA